ncbi:MAG: PD-(D/E)XK nuclease family protein [Synergistaceae bacterium]|nr:PD-(D/E)XK nuclease family protein [Synergistaceae bacterium]
MDSTNLFKYATKELSQDAFICWLMSFALKENHGKNPALESCALDLLHKIPGLETAKEISCIERQSYNIDVLLTVGDNYVIIEDKVYNDTYEGQIPGYKQKLVNADIDPEKIICVLYKIYDQPQPEQYVDYEFNREKLLQIMRPYKSTSSSDIFNYYVDYLEYIDQFAQFDKYPISEWSSEAYKKFFTSLKNEKILPQDRNFYYVNNYSGGFWGFSWDFCNDIDPSGTIFDSIYMQIENNIIAVKICADPIENFDAQKIQDARWEIFNYFSSRIDGFMKKVFRLGNYMTVGYLEYNEKNYREQISKIQKVFDEMRKELRLS